MFDFTNKKVFFAQLCGLRFCRRWCGKMSRKQSLQVVRAIRDGRLIGCAREVGGLALMPLILDKNQKEKVIDREGMLRLASPDGQVLQTEQECA